MISLLCPKCRHVLIEDFFCTQGQISGDETFCSNCSTPYVVKDGCIDLVSKDLAEKNFYENYHKEDIDKKENLNLTKIHNLWLDPALPERSVFLNELIKDDLKNKNILLLGNGSSLKELYFLYFGANIIYSDLSINEVLRVKNKFDYGKYKNHITFCAIDAMDIPFSDNCIDIVVGYAFTHHLDDLDGFISEVCRILSINGKCIFIDNGYAGLWQNFKLAFWPIIFFIANRRWNGISPQDQKFMHRGGYHLEEINVLKEKYMFSDLIFIRFGFFTYFFYRFNEMIFGYSKLVNCINNLIIPKLFVIDLKLAAISRIFYENTIHLIWGFWKQQ